MTGLLQRTEDLEALPGSRNAPPIELNTMAEPFGVRLEGEPMLHFSPRQDVPIWTIAPA